MEPAEREGGMTDLALCFAAGALVAAWLEIRLARSEVRFYREMLKKWIHYAGGKP